MKLPRTTIKLSTFKIAFIAYYLNTFIEYYFIE